MTSPVPATPAMPLDGLPEATTVLVVGGGPVGLVASLLLDRQGIDHVVIERRPTAQAVPAAHVVSARTFEILRAAGVDMDQVAAECTPADEGAWVRWVTTLAGDELGKVPFERQDRLGELDSVTPTPLRNLSQHRLERVLRDHVDGLVEGVEWAGIEQGPDEVVSTVRDVRTGEQRTVTARYVVAADGAGSRIRGALGIAMDGPDVLQNFVMIHVRADLRQLTGDRPATLYWTMDPEARGVFVAHDPGSTWVFMHEFDPDAELLEEYTPERCTTIVRRAIGRADAEVVVENVRSWRMSCQVAERFTDGRVFLVGDAAHRFPPTGGLGLNTGVADVHNLAWKLGAVERGWATAGLLDSYDLERRPVARTNADKSLENALGLLDVFLACGVNGPDGGSRADFERAVSTEAGRAAITAAVAGQAEHFDMLGLQLGFAYPDGTGPVLDDGSAPEPVANPVRQYAPSTRPGGRLPHAWVDRDGQRISTLELVPVDGFVLLTSSPVWAEAAAAQSAGGVPVSVVLVGRDVLDPDHTWADVAGLADDGAVLVRPDQHVAWRTRSVDPDPAGVLHGVLAALTSG